MPIPVEYRKEYFRKYREYHREAIRGYNNEYAKRERIKKNQKLQEILVGIGITKMLETFTELKERIIAKRPICEICGVRSATQLHHCLVHDMKKYHKELTVEENLMPVCESCHTSGEQTANRLEVRMKFALRQIDVYGLDVVKWYNGLPLKSKEYWLLNLEREA
jgi:deoxyxylulose-5-phosphate synthase